MQKPRPRRDLYEPLLCDESAQKVLAEPMQIELSDINVPPSEFVEPPELHEPLPQPRSEIVERVLSAKIEDHSGLGAYPELAPVPRREVFAAHKEYLEAPQIAPR